MHVCKFIKSNLTGLSGMLLGYCWDIVGIFIVVFFVKQTQLLDYVSLYYYIYSGIFVKQTQLLDYVVL